MCITSDQCIALGILGCYSIRCTLEAHRVTEETNTNLKNLQDSAGELEEKHNDTGVKRG